MFIRHPAPGGVRLISRSTVHDDDNVTLPEPDWRQRKRTATHDRLRAAALRLFGQQGYDATTVEQIAAAAGVSHMTFFRYFPTKEDVALSDSYDDLIVSLIGRAPATQPLAERVRSALLQGLRQVYDTDRDTILAQNKLIVSTPVLRQRLWANQVATQALILRSLDDGQGGKYPNFQASVTVAACLAAAATAVLSWTESDGTLELPDLVAQAFDILADLGRRP